MSRRLARYVRIFWRLDVLVFSCVAFQDWDGVPERLANKLKQCGFTSAQRVAISMKSYSEQIAWQEQQGKKRIGLSELSADDLDDVWLHFHPSKEDGQGMFASLLV
jgi:hypothetical protein